MHFLKKACEIQSDIEYIKCSRMDRLRFREVRSKQQSLKLTRIWMLGFLLVLLVASLATTDFMWFFYYETFWAFLSATFSLYATIKASTDPATWQKTAIISSEIAIALNLLVTLLFWGMMAPIIFTSDLRWEGTDLFLRV